MGARRGRWTAVLLVAAGGMAGLGPVLLATAQPAWAFVEWVYIDGQAYSPKLTEIDMGDKVIWRNRTDEAHSVTFDSLKWDETLGNKGAEAERRFNDAGKYTYRCKFHDGMTGTVVVNDPNAPTTTTTTTTAPPSTTTTARPTTTTTEPPTTTTTEPPTTTTEPPRPPAEVPLPPVPNTAAAPPRTLATSSTTTVPPTTTTTAAPATTTSAPPAPPAGDQVASPSTSASAPPTTETTRGEDLKTAAGLPGRSDDGRDVGTVALVSLLVAVGLFGAWTLIRVRPGRI